jgi:hypothetical protein
MGRAGYLFVGAIGAGYLFAAHIDRLVERTDRVVAFTAAVMAGAPLAMGGRVIQTPLSIFH